MLVSFIIPIHKPDTAILKKCLKSLKDQSYKDYEVITVLDGPDIEAEGIVKMELGKDAIIIRKEHGGAPAARNEGAKQAKGDILWFWDCDCIIEPDTCKTFVDEFKTNKEASFIYSGYKFLGENGGIASESFDPWTLRVANYISTCFPMRKEVFPGFDESLKSFQDWDLWLTIVNNGHKGHFIPGFAFSTKVPTPDSISGKAFTADKWLQSVKAIKDKHFLPNRKVCVSALYDRQEGIRLAKLINADYKDIPNYKPNNYDTIIQLGFSLHPGRVRTHTGIFAQPLKRKIIFYTRDNIVEVQNSISLKALRQYSESLNRNCIQFVEDYHAKTVMESAGFAVEVMPVPMSNEGKIEPNPEGNRVLLDITEEYRQFANCLLYALPDIKIDFIDGNKQIKDYAAIISLHPEPTMSFNIKRMLLSGKNIISNIQSPFCGYVGGSDDMGKYVSNFVDTIRKRINNPVGSSIEFWNKQLSPNKLLEVIKCG